MNCVINRQLEQPFSREDQRWMKLACSCARRAQGQSWPNPAVGCVLVSSDNVLLAVGYTQKGGRPHAEADALISLSTQVLQFLPADLGVLEGFRTDLTN